MFHHVKSVDLYSDGTLWEVLVLKEDPDNGDLYYIRADWLDEVDKQRARYILAKRDANKYELWDLMDQKVLPNGVNALEYFHQLVKVRSASGKHFTPQPGRMGVARAQKAQQAVKKQVKVESTTGETKSE